jgi:hypothetical protein
VCTGGDLRRAVTKVTLTGSSSPPTNQGPVVDSDALAKALHSGKIFGAGLDVVAGEPNITADHPLVKEPRCVVLPHIGSATIEARQAMADLCESTATSEGVACGRLMTTTTPTQALVTPLLVLKTQTCLPNSRRSSESPKQMPQGCTTYIFF